MTSTFGNRPSRVRGRLGLLCAAALAAACSGGGDGGTEAVVILGRVLDGGPREASVCLDVDANGRCDGTEPRTRTDAGGAYRLQVPKGSASPILAEVAAAVARNADAPDQPAKVSFRMASPAYSYSTDITPYTTLVHFSSERNLALAEDVVRDLLGLPSRFPLALDPEAAPTSLARTVAGFVVAALQSAEPTLDWSSPGVLGRFAQWLPPEITSLPTLAITTKDNAPIVSKEEYVDATYVLTHQAASPTTVQLNGRIRGRGHSTWGQPKNPYKVQFTNDALYAALPDVLGMRKNRNWALLADYFDRSLMRNKLAFSLGSSALFNDGMKWNPAGLHVEVTLNGDYVGVYLLTEDIRIDANRLDIKEMSSKESVNDVDGGYIVEADLRLDCYNQGDLNLQYVSPLLGAKICVDTPDEEDITQSQLAYIKDFLRVVEEDLVSGAGLSRLNPASFADWYLLSELFKNLDAPFFSSAFMWKDTDASANPLDRVLNMGPLWDFDISAGNMNYDEVWLPTACWVGRQHPEISPQGNWLVAMFGDEDFVKLTISRWKQKRPAIERFVNASLDTYTGRLQAPQQRNFARWPILGTPLTNYYTWQTWDEEVAFLRGFLNQRMAWMDAALATPASFAAMCR